MDYMIDHQDNLQIDHGYIMDEKIIIMKKNKKK